MRNKYILLVGLICLFLIPYISARTVEYNFNATFENISMFAYETTPSISPGLDNVPPTDGNPISTEGVWTDKTFDSDFDSDDDTNTEETSQISGPGDFGAHLFIALINDILPSDITSLNWSHNTGAFGNSDNNAYLWNDTSSSWIETDSGDGAEKWLNAIRTDSLAQYFNSTNATHFMIETATTNTYVSTDFVILTVTFTPTVTTTLTFPDDSFNTNALNPEFVCNYTSSSSVPLTNGTLYVWNASGTLNQTNVSVITGTANSTNLSLTFSADGDYLWNCLGTNEDNIQAFASANRTFTISTDAPSINLNYPSDNAFFNSSLNIYLNYTATDSNGISACEVWHDLNGTFGNNQTNYGVTSAQQNFTIVNATDDNTHNWNVFCNDTTDSATFATSNFSFTIDTIFPNVSIADITETAGSQTFTFDSNASDLNLDTCKFSIFNSSGGIDGLNENVSVSCNQLGKSATVSAFGTYNLTFYANDSANNENSTTTEFTTADIPAGAPGGGGGETTEIIVVGENVTWSVTTDTRSDKFDLIMTSGSKRERKLIFTNLQDVGVNIQIRCDDITGELCQYVSFENPNENASLVQETFLTQMTLTETTNEERVLDFIIDLPEDLPDGIYDFNIIGVDQELNTGSVSVRVRVGTFGFFSLLISKFLGTTSIGGLNVPNIILLIFPIIVLAPLLLLLMGKSKFKPFVVVLVPLSMIILILVFVD